MSTIAPLQTIAEPTEAPARTPAPTPPARPSRIPRLPESGAPPRRPAADILRVAVGMLLGLAAVTGLAELTGERLLSASLGATAVIVFALPGAPLAQPRAAIGGQAVATVCGLAVVATIGTSWFALALAGALAVAAMLATRTLHAPAGATALIVVLEDAGPAFLLAPVLAGTVLLVLVAYVVLNRGDGARWPEYWW